MDGTDIAFDMLKPIADNDGLDLNNQGQRGEVTKEFGYGINELTQGEAGHFRKANSIDAIRDRIAAAKR